MSPFGASNPFATNPFSGPFGYGSPLGIGSPFGLGSPLGLGVLAAPLGLGLLNPLGGGMGNAMYPALQMAPNVMSYQYLNQMANPYAGGPFAGNPYLQRGMPNPFSAPAFSPSMPSLPALPFSAPQPQGGMTGIVPMPQQPQFFVPYAMPVSPPPPPAASQTPWSALPAPAAQAVLTPQGMLPFAPAPVPVAPAPTTPPQSLLPFFPLAPQAAPGPAPEKATAPAKTPPPKAVAPAPAQSAAPVPAAPPMDPAAFMQMFMKPAEAVK
jgi:hypothetical protein